MLRNVVYRDAEHDLFREYIGGNRVGLTSWHSDVVRTLPVSKQMHQGF